MKYRAPVCLTELVVEKFQQLRDTQKVEYELSEIGKKFDKVLAALGEWGQEYIAYMHAQKDESKKELQK